MFTICDLNGDGTVTKAELIRALRRRPAVATALGFPSAAIKEGDDSKEVFLEVFSSIDTNNNNGIRCFVNPVSSCVFTSFYINHPNRI